MPDLKAKDPKDFWSGILFVTFGCAGLWFGRNYVVGTARRMGPGYFALLMNLALLRLGPKVPSKASVAPAASRVRF